MSVTVSTDGKPADIKMERSTGFTDLDEATTNWIMGKWRWNPPQQGCSVAQVVYSWTLPRAPVHVVQKSVKRVSKPDSSPAAPSQLADPGYSQVPTAPYDAEAVTRALLNAPN
jgi:hypothetical protein